MRFFWVLTIEDVFVGRDTTYSLIVVLGQRLLDLCEICNLAFLSFRKAFPISYI